MADWNKETWRDSKQEWLQRPTSSGTEVLWFGLMLGLSALLLAIWWQFERNAVHVVPQTEVAPKQVENRFDVSVNAQLQQQAQAGDAVAQYQLGLFYMRQNDERNALLWYEKSAAQNYAKAQNNLAVLYAEGRDVPRDMARACVLFELADQQLRTANSADNVRMCREDLAKQK